MAFASITPSDFVRIENINRISIRPPTATGEWPLIVFLFGGQTLTYMFAMESDRRATIEHMKYVAIDTEYRTARRTRIDVDTGCVGDVP